ncbi:lasso peptide biosynthesis B2 protein [bacterium]|nr:lasso peptide biosynthesis B2 protein [bacterium]MCI0603100.1 lasso peptide biosynthesis B2 protein [bacterium]
MKFNRQNLDKWKELSWKERRILLSAVLLLPATALALRFLGFNTTQSLLSRLIQLRKEKPPEELQKVAASTTRIVQIAASYGFYRASCLPQSLCLWWLLKLQSIQCELFLGMQKEADTFKGHAWVEVSGHVLNDHEDVGSRYISMFDVRK